jgi:hypothetical protein
VTIFWREMAIFITLFNLLRVYGLAVGESVTIDCSGSNGPAIFTGSQDRLFRLQLHLHENWLRVGFLAFLCLFFRWTLHQLFFLKAYRPMILIISGYQNNRNVGMLEYWVRPKPWQKAFERTL